MRFFARMRLDTATGLQCPHATPGRPCSVIVDGVTLSFGRRHLDVDPLAPATGGGTQVDHQRQAREAYGCGQEN